MVTYEGATKLLDFGIAKSLARPSRTTVGMVKGTSGYMSPEQILGDPLDARSDLFSLGVVLHECLTGMRLFHGKNPEEGLVAALKQTVQPPSQSNPAIPPELDAVVLKALAKQRGDRYATCLEFARALERTVGQLIWHPEQTAEVVQRLFSDRRDQTRELFQGAQGLTGEINLSSLKLDGSTPRPYAKPPPPVPPPAAKPPPLKAKPPPLPAEAPLPVVQGRKLSKAELPITDPGGVPTTPPKPQRSTTGTVTATSPVGAPPEKLLVAPPNAKANGAHLQGAGQGSPDLAVVRSTRQLPGTAAPAAPAAPRDHEPNTFPGVPVYDPDADLESDGDGQTHLDGQTQTHLDEVTQPGVLPPGRPSSRATAPVFDDPSVEVDESTRPGVLVDGLATAPSAVMRGVSPTQSQRRKSPGNMPEAPPYKPPPPVPDESLEQDGDEVTQALPKSGGRKVVKPTLPGNGGFKRVLFFGGVFFLLAALGGLAALALPRALALLEAEPEVAIDDQLAAKPVVIPTPSLAPKIEVSGPPDTAPEEVAPLTNSPEPVAVLDSGMAVAAKPPPNVDRKPVATEEKPAVEARVEPSPDGKPAATPDGLPEVTPDPSPDTQEVVFKKPTPTVKKPKVEAPKPPPEEQPPQEVVAPLGGTGTLTLKTDPSSEVFVKGRSLGWTPLVKLPMAAGKHTLKLVSEEAGTRLLSVTIEADALKKIDVPLDALQTGK